MGDHARFYIDGAWVEPIGSARLDVIDPARETPVGRVALGAPEDVDRAVAAARRAFPAYAATSREERIALLERIGAAYQARLPEIARTLSAEMGAPSKLAERAQAVLPLGHLQTALEVLKTFPFEEPRGTTLIVREPVGVCGFITPWNWPLNQIAAKVFPALAVGCTMVLKPSEAAPLNAHLFAEVLHEAGVPPGVFNLVDGEGPTVGAALAAHPDVDMISFTGSTRAGVEVARLAAPTVKRVHQELGGKSPVVVLPDADVAAAAAATMRSLAVNSGQSCNAPTRLIVPAARAAEALEAARAAAEALTVGPPESGADLGPVISAAQWSKIQGLVRKGLDEGATLVAGGPGKPERLEVGWYVRPTVLGDVTADMTVAREEIFGPVLSVLTYEDEAQAAALAEDSEYGLAAYVWSADAERARRMARRLRAGQVVLNGAPLDLSAPFGGFKRSGNGREWGEHGFHEFVEIKAVVGWGG